MENLIWIYTRVAGTDREKNDWVVFVSYYFNNFLKLYLSQSKKMSQFLEAATRGVLQKKLFLNISQYSQENLYVGVSF